MADSTNIPGVETRENDSVLRQLLSADQNELLNIIDELRRSAIIGDIELPLPQIIVCGDQSSGKSSLLEAISGQSFPKDENLCTTFPTELAIRRSKYPNVSVSIKPGPSRKEQEKTMLSKFSTRTESPHAFEARTAIKDAKAFLRENLKSSNAGDDSYYHDILHIGINDPKLPPLTLVDLPGIIHAPGANQVAEDISVVNDITEKYMRDPNSIILLVITAKNELEGQAIRTMAKNIDPEGERTMGIITKPDSLVPGSNRELKFVRCAQNEEHKLALKWHVVKNQDSEKKITTLEDREKEEAQFFSTGLWSDLDPEQLGVTALRTRLSTLLEQKARPALPKVIKIIQASLQETKERLNKLGTPRATPPLQRVYLSKISSNFEKLIGESVNGYYEDKQFFTLAESDTDPKRLRAAIANLNDSFAYMVRHFGHERQFLEAEEDSDEAQEIWPVISEESCAHFDIPHPEKVLKQEYVAEVSIMARRNRGKAPPGFPNYLIVPDLFREHSKRWELMAHQHIEKVRNITQQCLEMIAGHVGTEDTAAALRRHIIMEVMEKRHKAALKKVRKILKPYRRDILVCYDPDFSGKIQTMPRSRNSSKQNKTSEDLGHDMPNLHGSNDDNDVSEESEYEESETAESAYLLSYMLAYYKSVRRTFIENIVNLAVESCLIDDITAVFNPTVVIEMDADKLEKLASESPIIRSKRSHLTTREKNLEDALRICRLSSSYSTSTSSHLRPSRSFNIPTTLKGTGSLDPRTTSGGGHSTATIRLTPTSSTTTFGTGSAHSQPQPATNTRIAGDLQDKQSKVSGFNSSQPLSTHTTPTISNSSNQPSVPERPKGLFDSVPSVHVSPSALHNAGSAGTKSPLFGVPSASSTTIWPSATGFSSQSISSNSANIQTGTLVSRGLFGTPAKTPSLPSAESKPTTSGFGIFGSVGSDQAISKPTANQFGVFGNAPVSKATSSSFPSAVDSSRFSGFKFPSVRAIPLDGSFAASADGSAISPLNKNKVPDEPEVLVPYMERLSDGIADEYQMMTAISGLREYSSEEFRLNHWRRHNRIRN